MTSRLLVPSLLLLLPFAVACKRTSGATDGGVATTPSASGSSSAKNVAPSSVDQAWIDARTADPLELARLANLAGALRLGEVAGDDTASPSDRATAIRALAFASDPTPALEVLGKLVGEASVDRSTLALQTLAAVAPKRAPIEEVEPGAWRTCGEKVLAAMGSIQGAVRRELGIRVLLALADRGVVARAAVPAQ